MRSVRSDLGQAGSGDPATIRAAAIIVIQFVIVIRLSESFRLIRRILERYYRHLVHLIAAIFSGTVGDVRYFRSRAALVV